MFNSKKAGTIVLLFSFFFLAFIISCTKKSDETIKTGDNEKIEMVAVSNDDFTETDEDLLTVDYKEFYDELAPSGEWIEVTGKDIGVDLKKGSASGEKELRKITFAELFGVKDAYADDISFGSFFVWKPAPGLSVSITAGEPAPYEPYRNGQWLYTDAGWYFKAASPPEEITHHYGRWVFSPTAGWLWVPGRVWAPAWVDWREDEKYVAWTPIPPSFYFVNNVINVQPFEVERYYIVEKRYFVEPSVYKYMYKEDKNKIMIKEWRRIDGVMVMNKTVINKGPNVTTIEQRWGNPISVIKINKVKSVKHVKYTNTEIDVFSPDFKKNKNKGNWKTTVTKPGKFIKYEESVKNENKENQPGSDKKSENSEVKDKGKNIEKENGKKDEKGKNDDKSKGNEKYKENNGKGNPKLGDDSNMKNGKNKDNSKEKNNNDKGKQDKGKDKGKK